ncbi:pinopsin-like [Protopterus annectens]|uniref:pinopsin-like n=1 Tax=Protopterus annectens TaxID=7888 RepID=UPI001CFBFD66|nr:pinopsin-like [Protopterus annectens]
MTLPLSVSSDSFGNVLLLIFHAVFATAIAMVNGCVLIAILMTHSLRRENRFIFMVSTSISDCLVGLGWYYEGIFDVKDLPYPTKNGTFYILSTLTGVSMIILVAAQVERYIAVTSPFTYEKITRGRTITVCIVLWTWAYGMAVPINLFKDSEIVIKMHSITTLVTTVFTIFVMLVLNIKLFLIAKNQLKRDPPSLERENKKSSIQLIIVVSSTFLMCWTPALFLPFVCNMLGKCIISQNDATNIFAILMKSSSLATPVLYINGSSALKDAILKTVWRPCCIFTHK